MEGADPMAWVKLDDGVADHKKQLEAGAAACWLWVCGLAYCNRQKKRDGFIPSSKVPVLYPMSSPMKQAERLVAVGLWDVAEGGFRVHDYHDFQPALSDELRQQRAEAGRRGGLRSGERRKDSKAEASAEQVASENEATPRVRVWERVASSFSEALKATEEAETDAAREDGETPDGLMADWNAVAVRLPKARALSASRMKHCLARLRERPRAAWREVFARLDASAFCRGELGGTWRATFDWIIASPDNGLKALEGKYDGTGANKTTQETARRRAMWHHLDDEPERKAVVGEVA